VKHLFIILIGATIWGILLYSVIKFLPLGNEGKALITILITCLTILLLKLIDKNLEKRD